MPKSGTPREKLEGGRLKGGMFRSHLTWLTEHGKPGDRDAVLARLPEDSRQQLSGMILVSSWFPFGWLIALDRAIMEVCCGGRIEAIEDLGRWSATINLSTVYKAFDRQTNHAFFENSALLHRQFQDFGNVRYERTGETSGRMVLSEYPCYSPIFCASAIGYYQGVLESHGGKNARVRETECQCYGDPSCIFEMSWE